MTRVYVSPPHRQTETETDTPPAGGSLFYVGQSKREKMTKRKRTISNFNRKSCVLVVVKKKGPFC